MEQLREKLTGELKEKLTEKKMERAKVNMMAIVLASLMEN